MKISTAGGIAVALLLTAAVVTSAPGADTGETPVEVTVEPGVEVETVQGDFFVKPGEQLVYDPETGYDVVPSG